MQVQVKTAEEQVVIEVQGRANIREKQDWNPERDEEEVKGERGEKEDEQEEPGE